MAFTRCQTVSKIRHPSIFGGTGITHGSLLSIQESLGFLLPSKLSHHATSCSRGAPGLGGSTISGSSSSSESLSSKSSSSSLTDEVDCCCCSASKAAGPPFRLRLHSAAILSLCSL